jgi:hypothetical protein
MAQLQERDGCSFLAPPVKEKAGQPQVISNTLDFEVSTSSQSGRRRSAVPMFSITYLSSEHAGWLAVASFDMGDRLRDECHCFRPTSEHISVREHPRPKCGRGPKSRDHRLNLLADRSLVVQAGRIVDEAEAPSRLAEV